MATTRSVTVLTVHGRRLNVTVEPDMTILEILETACRKYKFAPELYDLKHHNRVLDLSTMFRFAGLPNNALLEMAEAKQARTEDDVLILLQLEDGARPSGTFKPRDSLLHVVQALCPGRPAGDPHTTLMVYMRREVYWDALDATTLRSLGLTKGRAILRLVQRAPEQANRQANVSAPLPRPAANEQSAGSTSTSSSSSSTISISKAVPSSETVPSVGVLRADDNQTAPVPTPDVAEQSTEVQRSAQPQPPSPDTGDDSAKKPKTDSTPPLVTSTATGAGSEAQPQHPAAHFQYIGERQAVLYHASTFERELADPDDSFFELTVPEVLQMYRQLQERVKALEEAPLVTGSLRELDRNRSLLSSMTRYRQAVIRVQFPDRHVLQGVFQVHETIAHVLAFVRAHLADPAEPFYLYTTPPKMPVNAEHTLLDAGCFPLALLHYGSESHQPTAATDDGASAAAAVAPSCPLRPALLQQLSNANGAALVASRAKRCVPTPQQTTAQDAIDSTTPDHDQPLPVDDDAVAAPSGPSSRRPPSTRTTTASTSASTTISTSTAREAQILKFLRK